MKSNAKLINSINHWRRNPVAWVHDKFGGKIRLSTQQKDYLSELGKLIAAKIKAHDEPTKLTQSDKDYAAKIGISIMAGQGVGKDFMAAMTMLFFLDCFPYPKITATGVTGKHLRNILWAECAKVMGLAVKADPDNPQSETILESVLQWQTERIFHKGIKNPGSQWFAEAVTINPHSNEDEQAKTLYGRHEDYQLIVVDEAASVPEPVFGPLEGTLTRKCCIALMIFNPTRAKGYAYDSHHKSAEQWITLNWNAEESELVSREHIEKMARYGRESNTYRVKVMGLPPLVGEGGLIPYDKINEAVEREFDVSDFDPVIGSVDAGGGGDRSIVCVRQGPLARFWSKVTPDPDQLVDWSSMILRQEEADVAHCDNIGLGWYLPKGLQNKGINARPADSRSTKDLKDPNKFVNKRAEMYWDLAQAFIQGAISIPNDEELLNELGAITRDDVGNKVKIEDKKQIRKKLGYSPDKADALAMTFYKPDAYYRKSNKGESAGIKWDRVFIR